MQKSKTHFEQIPVELVKKIAKEDVSDNNDENDGAVTTMRCSENLSLSVLRRSKLHCLQQQSVVEHAPVNEFHW